MLNEAERRRLEELDALMISEEPALAEACRDMRPPSRSGRSRRTLAVISAIMAVVALIIAVMAHEAALAALGLLLAGYAALQHLQLYVSGD
jgi:Protein of unknown function (DUF3040)